MPLYRPSELHKLGFQPKRRLSHNFLIDQNIIEKMCSAADVKMGDTILEIGPGHGAITEKLLQKKARVIAIEKDHRLAENLRGLAEENALKIFSEDALTFPLDALPSPLKIVANLPFHITTPLLLRFIQLFPQITSLTVVVQKEVGKRITAEKNTPEYGSLSLFLKTYSSPSYCFTIKPTSFFPAPSVSACVIHFQLRAYPYSFSPELFFRFTRTAFSQRRKMLKSSLKTLYNHPVMERASKKLNLPLTKRPEELSLEEFASFFIELEKEQTPEWCKQP